MDLQQQTDQELKGLKKEIEQELYRRNPPRVTEPVRLLLEQLKVTPVIQVAEASGRTKQYLYRLCNQHFITPVKENKKATP